MRMILSSSRQYDVNTFNEANAAYRALHFQESHLDAETAILAHGFEVVCPFVNDNVDAAVLQRLHEGGTRLIALRSAGFNHVDLATARRLGLTVVRVPAYSPHAVAEQAAGLILALNRRLPRAAARTREGDFSLNGPLGFDLHGKTVGVIGTGMIALGARYVPLDTLLAEADIVSLHCPLVPGTYHLIDERALARMKRGAMLINTGRGGLVESNALIGALKSGQLGNLGLDVYEEEGGLFFEDRSNLPLQDDVLARLLMFPNVIVTAHQAFFTREAMNEIAQTTLGNVPAWQGGTPRNVVQARA
jgi:D-lactate dehydrogenase